MPKPFSGLFRYESVAERILVCGCKQTFLSMIRTIVVDSCEELSMIRPRRHNAPVAQLDRVPGYEPGGREFESLRARHHTEQRLDGFLLVLSLFRLLFVLSLSKCELRWASVRADFENAWQCIAIESPSSNKPSFKLAVMGRLVPHPMKSWPVCCWRRKIAEKKERIQASRRLKPPRAIWPLPSGLSPVT